MNETQYVDAEQFTGGQNESLSFKEIVLRHLQRITQIASQEFHGGYYTFRPFSTGHGISEVKTYVPDQLEAYINAVDNLYDLLFPYYDDELTKEVERIDKAHEEEYSKYVTQDPDTKQKLIQVNSRRKLKKKYKRQLFRALTSFLYRRKYLELAPYEE